MRGFLFIAAVVELLIIVKQAAPLKAVSCRTALIKGIKPSGGLSIAGTITTYGQGAGQENILKKYFYYCA
jgi:hypothetical protein